ncbi:MAG: hypothetical protein ACE5HV_07250 [Acidobacteriota bacterium]
MQRRFIGLGVACLVIAGLAWGSANGAASPVADGAPTAVTLPPLQEQPGAVSRSWVFKVKPGAEGEFEEAIKAFWQWRRQENDPWEWIAYTIETGDQNGEYGFVSLNHQWADLDANEASRDAVNAKFRETIAPHVASYSNAIRVGLPQLSTPSEGETVNLVQVYDYHLKYDKAEDFIHAVEKIHKALAAADWPRPYSWSTLASGGANPTYRLAVFCESWADMAPAEASFRASMEKMYGSHETAALLQTIADSVWGVDSWIARVRLDLSYLQPTE